MRTCGKVLRVSNPTRAGGLPDRATTRVAPAAFSATFAATRGQAGERRRRCASRCTGDLVVTPGNLARTTKLVVVVRLSGGSERRRRPSIHVARQFFATNKPDR